MSLDFHASEEVGRRDVHVHFQKRRQELRDVKGLRHPQCLLKAWRLPFQVILPWIPAALSWGGGPGEIPFSLLSLYLPLEMSMSSAFQISPFLS